MSASLPESPNLEQLRKQAKDLLKAQRARQGSVCGVLRHLRQFRQASDEAILTAELTLNDAQHALAKEYGFKNWPDLKQHVQGSATGGPEKKLRREAGRVWIEGVPELRWGQSGECTFAGALAAALAVTARPVSYADLMGYSGLAFRSRWFRRFDQPDWCPSSPVGEFSEEIQTVTQAIGWRVQQKTQMQRQVDEGRWDMSDDAAAIRQSIDAGLPVVGYPDADLNVGVCYGYEQVGQETTFLWHAYGRKDMAVSQDDIGPWLMVLEEAARPMEPAAALVQALTTPNWRRQRLGDWRQRPGVDGAYLYGPHAMRQWRDDIAHAEQFSIEQRKKLFRVGWWCYDCLMDARQAAATFLREHAAEVPGQARAHLLIAAETYQRLFQMASQECFEKHNVFLGLCSGKEFEDWTPDVRQREQDILSQADALDSAAASEIDKALNALQ